LAYNNDDKERLKPLLKQFLKLHGIEFNSAGKFTCPFHLNDDTPSMGIVKNSGGTQAYCFGCGESKDIFAFAAHFYGLDEKTDFVEIKKRVAEELGQTVIDTPIKTDKSEKPAETPVTLSVDAAKAIYTKSAIIELGKWIFKNDIKEGAELALEKAWPCLNADGNVEFVEVRFSPECFINEKKRPCAVWWNGKQIKSKGNPHGLFGRELLAQYPDKPILIVEGPKCQEAAKALTDFVPVAWNGGAHGQKKVDFSPLCGKRVYIWPDDDEAGGKSAHTTAKLLQDIAAEIIIVQPLPEARQIKPEKADIVEALQIKTPEEITRYIKNHTPPVEQPKSNDPYIQAGVFLMRKGFYKIYDKKSIGFYSTNEEQPYNYAEIRDKFAEDETDGLNPAKAAKMINNLDPVYPVYHLVKSFGYPPLYMGRNGKKNEYIINRWRGFQYPLRETPPGDPEIEAEVDFVKAHIKNVLCGGSEEDYNYLCKWIAHIFQKPDIKPGVAVFAHSDTQGTGKSLVFEQLIPNMLGIDITRVFSNEEQISEKFNAWLFESLYVVFSEKSFYNNTENIKAWITDPNQSRRDMGMESRQERSFARFIICTNRESSFKFEKSERRMFVLNVSSKEVGNWPYFDRLGAAVSSAAVIDRMARFFCSIDISSFNTFDLPASQKKMELIETEKHPVIDYFYRVINGETRDIELTACEDIDPYGDNYFKAPALYDALKKICTAGDLFIEREKLYRNWKNTDGRNRKETATVFTRLIKKEFSEKVLEVLDKTFRINGKVERLPIIVLKKEYHDKHM